MAVLKNHHTQVTSCNTEKTANFYMEVLGAKFTGEKETAIGKFIDVDLGGIPIRISSATGADKKWDGSPYGLHHLGLTVDSMDEFAAKMRANEVEFVVEPFESRPGLKVAFIRGPDNVLFEILEIENE